MKRFFVWGLPLIIILSLVGWRLRAEKASAAEATGQAAGRKNASQAADLAVAGPATLETVVDAVGSVESPYKVDLSPKTSGRIDFLDVREGDAVTKGQVLVRLNLSDLQGQLLQQQATVAEARAKLAEAQISKSTNDVTILGNIRQQEANLSTVKAELEQAQQTFQAQIATAQAGVTDAAAKVRTAESEIRNAKARIGSVQADADNAKLKSERYVKLLAQGFIAGQLVDDAKSAYQVSLKQVDVAQAEVEGSQSDLESAQAQLNSAKQQLEIAKKKASVDVKTAQARVIQAKASLDVAKAGQSGSRAYMENLAALAAGVRSAEGQLSQAQSKQDETELASSIDGVVTARNADPGAIASAGQAVLTVQYLKWLYVKAALPIENASKVKVGKIVKISFDSFPDRTWTGTISQVNPSADTQTRQFTFQVRLENPDGQIRPGMYAQVKVPLDMQNVEVAVPKDAVQDSRGKKTVRVSNEKGEIEVREVTTGDQNDKLIQIVSGLKAGEKVVALSYTPLKDGQKVKLPGEGKGQGAGKGAAK